MRNKRKAPDRSKGSMFKKRKRSKKFWQQRKTAEITPAPVEDDETESSEDSEVEDTTEQNNYEALVSTFTTDTNVVYSDAETSEEEAKKESGKEDSDDSVDNEESGSSDNDSVDSESNTDDPKLVNEEEIDHDEVSNEESSDDDANDDAVDDDDNEDENVNDINFDPFGSRVTAEIPSELKVAIESKKYDKDTFTWPNLGQILVSNPQFEAKNKSKKSSKKLLDDDEEVDEEMEKFLSHQLKLVKTCMKQPHKQEFYLNSQLKDNLAAANVKNLSDLSEPLTPFQSELFSCLSTYKDLYYSDQSLDNLEQIRLVYVLHALNHMLKTRRKILKNNEKVKKNSSSNLRDQGLCRPKILIIVPFKGM